MGLAAALISLLMTTGCSTANNENAADEAGYDDTTGIGRGKPGPVDGEADLPVTDGGPSDVSASMGPPSLVSLQLACNMRADRHCRRLEACASFGFRARFGKYDTCRTRLSALCAAEAALPDTGHTSFSLVRCAQAIMNASCQELLDGHEPEACQASGGRREGAGCGSHVQCTSGFCKSGENGEGCGSCQAKGRINEACAEETACMWGLVCASGRCLKPGSVGAPCGDEFSICKSNLACLQGHCTLPLASGTACEGTTQCAYAEGYVCSADETIAEIPPAPLCRASSVGMEGDVCQINGNVITHCSGGQANCAVDLLGTYRCVRPAKDGQPCGDPEQSAGCEAPARCVAGTCRAAPPTHCNP